MPLALYAQFLAAFSIGTTEFVVAGLLPEISRDLAVPIPTAGLLVSVYAIGVAVGGPALSLLTSRFPQKLMLLVLMGIFVLGHVFCAMAPTFKLLLAARVVVSMSHGNFFGLAAIIAVGLVHENKQGAALAVVFAGITVANILGVPIGTAIGNAFGWRATFWIVGGVAVLAAIALIVFIPNTSVQSRANQSLRLQFAVLGNQKVYTSYAIIILMMIGFWSVFTFVSPILTHVSGIAPQTVPWVLLLFGVGATIGILIGGRLADRVPEATLIAGFPAQFLVYALMLVLNRNPAAMSFLLFCMGVTGFVVGALLQNRILKGAAASPHLASTMISTVFNIGIATGASLGGIALSHGVDYALLPAIGCALALGTTAIAVVAARLDRRVSRSTV